MKHEERLLEKYRGMRIRSDYQEEGYTVLDKYNADFSVCCSDEEIIILCPEPGEDEDVEASVHLTDGLISDIEIERLNPHRSDKLKRHLEWMLGEFLDAVCEAAS
ncbi:MAG: hypothetical protein IJT77_03465 [Clostridia bacterium]|nr:hypothetical protein [Clostridia bacterium]